MTPAELKTLRQRLGLSVPWCADRVGGVSDRSWKYWESGERSVPDDVIQSMGSLAKALRPWAELLPKSSDATKGQNEDHKK